MSPFGGVLCLLAKAAWRLVCWIANYSLIHTKSGCRQQPVYLLQYFEFPGVPVYKHRLALGKLLSPHRYAFAGASQI
jgi:hypothetical protein